MVLQLSGGAWLDVRIVLESAKFGRRKQYRISRFFVSDFRLLRPFVIGRMKRLEEIKPRMSECVRVVCDLMSDVLKANGKKKVLRAIGVRRDPWVMLDLTASLQQTIKTLTRTGPVTSGDTRRASPQKFFRGFNHVACHFFLCLLVNGVVSVDGYGMTTVALFGTSTGDRRRHRWSFVLSFHCVVFLHMFWWCLSMHNQRSGFAMMLLPSDVRRDCGGFSGCPCVLCVVVPQVC